MIANNRKCGVGVAYDARIGGNSFCLPTHQSSSSSSVNYQPLMYTGRLDVEIRTKSTRKYYTITSDYKSNFFPVKFVEKADQ